jgi:hypothetical protein
MSSAWINPHTIRRVAHAALSPGKELLVLVLRGRRVLILVATSLLTVAVATAALAGMVVVSVPAAVPVVIAGTVLSNTADLFGAGVESAAMSGTELADAGRASQISCHPGSPSIDPPLTPSPAPGADTDAVAAPAPMRIESDGSLSRADTSVLIDPAPPKTSALIAHVWFLYRLAGIGDWESFIAAYQMAGLRGDDTSTDAPLAQVQALNTGDADVGRYRLTAAALTAAGVSTGRLTDPYPSYQELVGTELVTACLDDKGADERRMTLPPPSTAAAPAAQQRAPHEQDREPADAERAVN